MSADEHLNPQQFHYHQSPAMNRFGIDKEGLRADLEEGYGSTAPGVYMSPKPSDSRYEDVWKVNTTGLHLHPDSDAQQHEFRDVGGSYYTEHDIPRDRLSLHRKAQL